MIGRLKTYFIREHVGAFKLSDAYDILDPGSNQVIGVAKERPGGLIHLARFIVNKQMLPTRIDVHEGPDPETDPVSFSISRGFSLFRPRINVIDSNGQILGWFKSKMFSFGGAFRVFDENDNEVALVKGDWKGWHFRFLFGEVELGTVTKKWSGMGKELFTSADNYVVSLNEQFAENKSLLLLAAGLSIDILFKE